MLEKALTNLIWRYADDYLYGFNQSNVQTRFLRGTVELKDLFIKPKVLASLPGIQLSLGYVGSISLRIPWKSFWRESFSIEVSTIYLVTSGKKPQINIDNIKQRIADNIKSQLRFFAQTEQRILNEHEKKIQASVGNLQTAKPPKQGKIKQWLIRLQNLVINNVQINITNVSLIWMAPKLHRICIGISLENLCISTIESSEAGASALKKKACIIDGISLCYYPLSKDKELEYKSLTKSENEDSRIAALTYWKDILTNAPRTVVIDPIKTTIAITLCPDFIKQKKPLLIADLELSTLKICSDLPTAIELIKSLSTYASMGELGFVLSEADIDWATKDITLEEAVTWLGRTLFYGETKRKIETQLSSIDKDPLDLKEQVHTQFKLHYLVHLRHKYIAPLLFGEKQNNYSIELKDKVLEAIQSSCGYVGPSARILVELTASIPMLVLAKLQQECISVFLSNLSAQVDSMRNESLGIRSDTLEQISSALLDKSDLDELKKLAGLSSVLELNNFEDSATASDNDLELLQINVSLISMELHICEEVNYNSTTTKQKHISLLTLHLNMLSSTFCLLRSSNFSFTCQIKLLTGACAATDSLVLSTQESSSALSINVATPGSMGGSMYIQTILAPLHIVLIPEMLPFVFNLTTTFGRTPGNPIILPIKKASAFDLVTLYNDMDETINSFIQERAAFVELDAQIGAPVLMIVAPSAAQFVCSLGRVLIQSRHFVKESPHLPISDTRGLTLFIQLADTVVTIADTSQANESAECLPIIKPITFSVRVNLPLSAEQMKVEVVQGLLDININSTNIRLLLALCNVYMRELFKNSLLEKYLASIKQRAKPIPKLAKTNPLQGFEKTTQLLSTQMTTLFIIIVFQGIRLRIGDTDEIKLCIEQGHTTIKCGSSIIIDFQLCVFDLFLCDAPVIYFTNDIVICDREMLASGSLKIDSRLELNLQVGVLHILADTTLIMKVFSMINKMLYLYINTDLPILLNQLSYYSFKPSGTVLHSSAITSSAAFLLLVDFGGLELHILSSSHSFPTVADPDVTLICSINLSVVYIKFLLESGNIYVNWTFKDCTVKQPIKRDELILQFVTPSTSEACMMGCIHLYNHTLCKPNLLLQAQVIGDIQFVLDGRILQYLAKSSLLIVDCLSQMTDVLSLAKKSKKDEKLESGTVMRLSLDITVPNIVISIPVRLSIPTPYFILSLMNISVLTTQSDIDFVISYNIVLGKLLGQFTEYNHSSTSGHIFFRYEDLTACLSKTYKLYSSNASTMHETQGDIILLTRQHNSVNVTKALSLILTPTMLSSIMELISIDGNLGFSTMDDSDESKLSCIRNSLLSATEEQEDDHLAAKKYVTQSINQLLDNNLDNFLLDGESIATYEHLDLGDDFLDTVEEEYSKAYKQSEILPMNMGQDVAYNPPPTFIVELVFNTLCIQIANNTSLITELKLDPSTIKFERSSGLAIVGNIGALVARSDTSPFPLMELTPWTLRYSLEVVSKKASVSLSEPIKLSIIISETIIHELFTIFMSLYTPSSASMAFRQRKQEIVLSINESIALIRNKDQVSVDRHKKDIFRAMLSTFCGTERKQMVVTDKPLLAADLPVSIIKFIVIVSAGDVSRIKSLSSTKYVEFSMRIGLSMNILFKRRYIYDLVSRQVQDLFERAEMHINAMLANFQLATHVNTEDSSTTDETTNSMLLVSELDCNISKISTRTQEDIVQEQNNKSIIVSDESFVANINIRQQAKVSIYPSLLQVLLLVKDRIMSAIPYSVLQKAKDIAMEKLEQIKTQSIMFLKGDSQSKGNMHTPIKELYPGAILNPVPIIVNGVILPVYTVTNEIVAEIIFEQKLVITVSHSFSDRQPLFILNCGDITCRYKSVIDLNPNVPQQSVFLKAALQIKSYNDALKLYDVIMCTLPLSLSFDKYLHPYPLTNIPHVSLSDSAFVWEKWKNAGAEVKLHIGIGSEVAIFMTPSSIFSLLCLKAAFSTTSHDVTQTDFTTTGTELTTRPEEGVDLGSASSVLSMTALSASLSNSIHTRRRQILEFHPSNAIQSFTVYVGASEYRGIKTSEGLYLFELLFSDTEDVSIWIEFSSEGITKTIQLPLELLIFQEQQKLDANWTLVSISQLFKLSIHCISTCILLNYCTEEYLVSIERAQSSILASASTESSSFVEISNSQSILTPFRTVSVVSYCKSEEKPCISCILRKNSYISIPRTSLSIQICRAKHAPLELIYYLLNTTTDGHEVYLICEGYRHIKIVTSTIELMGSMVRVIQLAPVHILEHGMPCTAQLKLIYLHLCRDNTQIEIQDEELFFFPGESVSLKAMAGNTIRLASLFLSLPYGTGSENYTLKTTYCLPHEDDLLDCPVSLELKSTCPTDNEIYFCNAVTTEQIINKTESLDIFLLTDLRAPSTLRIKTYVNAVLKNEADPSLSFIIFRLDSRYGKRTPVTAKARYKETVVLWGKLSDAMKLSVSKTGAGGSSLGESLEYHKSEQFKLSGLPRNYLHCLHSKNSNKKTTLFIGAISNTISGSLSLMYTLCPAIRIHNKLQRIIHITIAPWDQTGKRVFETLSIHPGDVLPIFELPWEKETFTDYSVRVQEEQTSQFYKIKLGHLKQILNIESSISILSIYCEPCRLQLILRPARLDDGAQIKIHNRLDIDLYCMYRKSSTNIKYLVPKKNTTQLQLLLSPIDFYCQGPKVELVHLLNLNLQSLNQKIEVLLPGTRRKCQVRLTIDKGAVYCEIFPTNEPPLEEITTTEQVVLISARLEIKAVKIFLIGPDKANFAQRSKYMVFRIAFLDTVFLLTKDSYQMCLQCGQTCLENVLGQTNQPMIFQLAAIKAANKRQLKSTNSIINILKDPAISVVACISTRPVIIDIRYINIHLGKFNLYIDQSALDITLQFLRSNSLLSALISRNSVEKLEQQMQIQYTLSKITNENEKYRILLLQLCTLLFDSTSRSDDWGFCSQTDSLLLYINTLIISQILSKITISIERLPFQSNSIIIIINQLGIVLFTIENANLKMGSVKMNDRLLSLTEFTQFLRKIYIKAASMNAGNILAATPMLGNLSSLADHFIESFKPPTQSGITRIEHFISHNTVGVMSVARAIFENVGRLLSAASMDSKYSAKRSMELYNSQKNLKTVWRNSGREFWREFKSAFTGLVSKPRKGFATGGIQGFFRGLGRGLVGSVTKSLGSINDAILHLVVGINGNAMRVCKPIVKQSYSHTFCGPITDECAKEDTTGLDIRH